MVSEAQRKASERYDREHTTGVYLKLNKKTDADILARLAASGNRQGYIKKLIREDMYGHNGCNDDCHLPDNRRGCEST